ncbi:hypothetical protein VTN00DRAFT_3996 [Thermoascus crustaceus]|uniref:uncharacterized protein n=1 Tax=Thermoascus crustaceus TaxID=5088 RepID=UPI003743A3DC
MTASADSTSRFDGASPSSYPPGESVTPPGNGQEQHGHDILPLKTAQDQNKAEEQHHNLAFWLVFLSLCMLSFTSAPDGSIITTALPKVTASIGGQSQYIWIANSFTIAQTEIQPFCAQLCDIFGRRGPLLVSIALFVLGSGLAGGANNVSMLIAGRTAQGLGSGNIFSSI